MAAIDEELATIGAVVIEDRILRRLIKGHRRLRGAGLQVPHAECYTLARTALEKLVEPGELQVAFGALPDHVVAITGDRVALENSEPAAWSRAWRSIFHGHIHHAFEDRLLHGKLTRAVIRERINRIGQTEFDEIRYVLRQEDRLLPPADDTTTYIEFVALYLEVEQFEPGSLERTFSTLKDEARVLDTIRRDIDPAVLLAASRPTRAPDRPLVETITRPATHEEVATETDPTAAAAAIRARKRGNHARAAILAMRSGGADAARVDIDQLVTRLVKVLGADKGESPADKRSWAEALLPVARASGAQKSLRLTPGARLFHDLQSACIVGEREFRVVDLATWAASLGKRPIVRALPASREVRIAKHVHAALAKITGVDLPTREDREWLAEVVNDMVERADQNVRTVLRPAIEAALDAVELQPRNLPERVGEKKVVDELLDKAVAVGHISLSNLRDAISQNELKLPDLQSAQLWSEDQLLKTDRLLATSLDGVYRRGEIYMRFLQKLSSVFFGTRLGRLLCLYILLPALGSFAVIEGLQHMVGPVSAKLFGVHPVISTKFTLAAGMAVVFLLIHVGIVRRGTMIVLRAIGTVLRILLWRGPRAFLELPIVRMVMTSHVGRYVIRPAIPTLIVAALGSGPLRWPVAAGVFVLFQVIFNARVGRLGQEVLGDWAVRSGRHVSQRMIPGIVRLTIDVFAKLIELVDRAIYRVDGYLRFRKGQSFIMIGVKAILGFGWFVITYLLRIYINMFIEPVVNPVKHFPVVTVAGKIMLPLFPAMLSGMTGFLEPFVGLALARSLAGFTVFVFPGLAGFLVWELKANWFLYRATRARTLAPTVFGSHGETMVGLMKPGFHSGTIPKLFAKLRRATWKSDERAIAKQEQSLHHVEEALWKFFDREFVSLLNESKSFGATDVALKHVTIAANRIQFELVCPSVDSSIAMITIEQQSGWLVAGVSAPGWISCLDEDQRRIYEIALAGFYKLAAIDLVREQLEAILGGRKIAYDISDEGLVAWPGDGYLTEVIYDLRSPGKATVRGPSLAVQPPSFDDRRALYHRESMPWSTWATTWEQLAVGKSPARIVSGPELLPPREQATSVAA